ncbi:MAG: 30S ribosomal protein S24e [Candidatus Bathyarchaeia archaeon]
MKIKILSERYNPLLKRKEVVFEVDHSPEGQTTSRLELRKRMADTMKTNLDLVFIRKVETKTGTMIGLGEANVYETLEEAKLVEPKHIIARNAIPQKSEETEKPKTEGTKLSAETPPTPKTEGEKKGE